MSTTLRQRIIGSAALAAATLVALGTLAASPAAGAGPDLHAKPPAELDRPILTLPGTSLATLEDAVAAGRLDRELVVRLRERGSVEALVTFEQDAVLDHAEREAPLGKRHAAAVLASAVPALRAKKQRALRQIEGEFRVLHQFRNLALSYVRFDSAAAVLDTVNAPGVSGVRVNTEARAGLASSLPLINEPAVAAQGDTGAGTYVAVLDTGVDYTRAAFGSCTAPGVPAACRVAATGEIAPDDKSLDDDGHGTNVSGIVAGVAPGTKLIVYDVFDDDGTNALLVSRAIDSLVQLKRQGVNVRAVNLSIGNAQHFQRACAKSPYAASFTLARSVGILPVVSAGNSAYDARHRFRVGLAAPACAPGAISVGAVYDKNWGKSKWSACTDRRTNTDKITCFSQTGRTLTLLAPGALITAAGETQAGTSQAAPHVAGAVAVLAAVNPGASLDQIRAALASTGKSIKDKRSKIVRRRLDLAAAVARIGRPPAPPPPPPPTDRTPPTLSGPTQSIPQAWTLGSTGATPLVVTWNGSDASGIASYRLFVSVNGGSPSEVQLSSASTTSVTFSDLQPGSSYQFTVTARDGAGNLASATGPRFTVGLWQESSASYSTGWTLLAWGQDLGGWQASTSSAGATATFSFTGRAIAWIAPASTLNGQAYLWLDGTYLGYVDGYSSTTTARKIIFSRNVDYGTHTLRIQAVGTSGRPQVDIDAFDVLH
jgi:hypothetical protein